MQERYATGSDAASIAKQLVAALGETAVLQIDAVGVAAFDGFGREVIAFFRGLEQIAPAY
jgi:hypothetical protein